MIKRGDVFSSFSELQSYARHIRPPPMSQVVLYFDEDSTEPQRPGRTLTVQVIYFETHLLSKWIIQDRA